MLLLRSPYINVKTNHMHIDSLSCFLNDDELQLTI